MYSLPNYQAEAFIHAEERFQQEFLQRAGEISLADVVVWNADGPTGPQGLPLDRFALVPLTSVFSRPMPSRIPLCHNVAVPENVAVEYYEQVSHYNTPTLRDTPYIDAAGAIGLVGRFPKRRFGRLTFGSKQVLLAISSGGVYPNLGIPGIDKDEDRPVYIVSQLQGLVRADLQPEYAGALRESGFSVQGTLLRAQEELARRLGINRIALRCPYNIPAERSDDIPPEAKKRLQHVQGTYAQTAKKTGYPRRIKQKSTYINGLLWSKELG